jgi:hypothetical protein
MKKLLLLFLPLIWACQKQEKPQAVRYQTLDYVSVGKLFGSTKWPYIIDLKNENKRLVFVGCNHVYCDSTHPQFAKIEKYFKTFKPQIAFNEGGQITKTYKTRNDGILQNGETGLLKYCSDKANIKMMNGDIPDSLEFRLMLKKVPKDKLYLYYFMERIVGPYAMGAYREKSFDENVKTKIQKWFVAEGFPLNKNEQDYEHVKKIYLKYMGKPLKYKGQEPFTAEDFDLEAFDYINPKCEFCAIGRVSKEVRDSVLLSKIDQALDQYDRVIVTFGGGHALAVEPALKQIIAKKRN